MNALYREAPPIKRALPMLDRIRIATPCDAPWEDMVGDDKVRFCGKCEKHVYDLSAMTRYEAESFLLEHEENLPCLRFYRRADGRILTSDCPVGVRWKWKRRRTFASRVAGVAILALLGRAALDNLSQAANSASDAATHSASDAVNGPVGMGIGAVAPRSGESVYK